MVQNELPPKAWPVIVTLIVLVMAIVVILGYARWRVRKGWNDAPDEGMKK